MHKLIKLLAIRGLHWLYHDGAWAYDLVANIVSLGRWRLWILTTMGYLDKGPILEVGHGPGHLLVALSRIGYTVVGVDSSSQMSHLARNRLSLAGLHIDNIQASALCFPFPADYFHHIVATFPTQYILEPETVYEIRRVLQPGGTAVILPFAVITATSIIDRLAAWLFEVTGQSPKNTGEFNLTSWEKAFQDADLSTEWHDVNLHHSQLKVLVLHS